MSTARHDPGSGDPSPRPDPGPPTTAERPRARVAVGVLATLAVLAALDVAKLLLLPILMALLLSQLLTGPVVWLERRKVPRAIGAALLLGATAAGVGVAVWQLSVPAIAWLERAPHTFDRLERELRSVRGSVEDVSRAAEQVQEMTDLDGSSKKTQKVQVEDKSATAIVLDQLVYLASTGVVVFVLVFLLLVYGEHVLVQLLQVFADPSKRNQSRSIALRIQREVSRYLLTITIINACLGVSVGVVCQLVGLPSPWLWGALAALLNYVPYLGGMAGVAVVAVVAITNVEPTSQALLAPALYGLLTMLEGMLITPVIVGSRFAVNPLVVFVWLLAWGWLWGVAGMLIAIPLLTIVKVLADSVPGWEGAAFLLAQHDRPG